MPLPKPEASRPSPSADRIFQYVVHHEIEHYEAGGWKIAAGLGMPHGEYSVLMEFVEALPSNTDVDPIPPDAQDVTP